MPKLKEVEDYFDDYKDLSVKDLDNEIIKTEENIKKGEIWFSNNDETNELFDSCFIRLRDLLRKRAALYLIECEPKEVKLF